MAVQGSVILGFARTNPNRSTVQVVREQYVFRVNSFNILMTVDRQPLELACLLFFPVLQSECA